MKFEKLHKLLMEDEFAENQMFNINQLHKELFGYSFEDKVTKLFSEVVTFDKALLTDPKFIKYMNSDEFLDLRIMPLGKIDDDKATISFRILLADMRDIPSRVHLDEARDFFTEFKEFCVDEKFPKFVSSNYVEQYDKNMKEIIEFIEKYRDRLEKFSKTVPQHVLDQPRDIDYREFPIMRKIAKGGTDLTSLN